MIQYAAFVLAYITLAVLMAYLGQNRKWGFWGYLWASILFTPLFGLLFVLAADAKPKPGKALLDEGENNQ